MVAATGCASPAYQAGSLDGETHRLGCVDLAVHGAWPHESEGPVVVIELGNRCEHSVAIDLRQLEVFSDGAFGSARLTAYDPDGEIDVRRIGVAASRRDRRARDRYRPRRRRRRGPAPGPDHRAAARGAVKRVLLAIAMLDATSARVSHCHETSRVVGREVCLSYGDRWAHRSVDELEISAMNSGFVLEHIAFSPFDHTGTAYRATGSAAYHAMSAPGTRSTMWTLGYRTGLRWHDRHTIAGLEFGGGEAIVSPTLVTTVAGSAPNTSSSASVIDLAGYGGAHTRIGSLDFSALLVIGTRWITAGLALPDEFIRCDGGRGPTCAADVDQLLVEVRGGVDLWLGRNVTLGVSAGIDLADRAESLALELHVHLAPFDGS